MFTALSGSLALILRFPGFLKYVKTKQMSCYLLQYQLLLAVWVSKVFVTTYPFCGLRSPSCNDFLLFCSLLLVKNSVISMMKEGFDLLGYG